MPACKGGKQEADPTEARTGVALQDTIGPERPLAAAYDAAEQLVERDAD